MNGQRVCATLGTQAGKGRNQMYQTVQVSSCVSVQGFLVEQLPNGDAIVSDGLKTYRGRPIAPMNLGRSPIRALPGRDEA